MASKEEEKQNKVPESDGEGGNGGSGEENEVVFQGPECPVEKVTVYPDRAEVCRRVDTSLKQGLNQVVIRKLPERVDPDSIRVEGQGAATITEVVFHTERVPRGQGDISDQEKRLLEERQQLMEEKQELESELSVLKKQWGLLDAFANTASRAGTSGGNKDTGDQAAGGLHLTEPFFKGLTDFLQLYSQQGNELEKKQLQLNKKLEDLQKKIDANFANHIKLQNDRNCPDEVRKCIILVDCKETCKVLLLVSYVTYNAAWKPSYDIRMYSAEDVLKITYFGQIRQSTGEDWEDAKLFLSTAMPSIGGEIPDLQTAELSIYKPRPRHFVACAPTRAPKTISASFGLMSSELYDEEVRYDMAPPPPPPMEYAEAEVGEGMATTMYEIQRRSTVPSDDVEHKVTVGLISIKPKIHYSCIPQLVPHAFMFAKVTNSSPYTFLAGETSIFLDNTFVGKASIKDVYPMEEFDCSLGVDPAVKVTYKPQKKFQASSGLLSKTVSTTHEQVVVLKNTHDFPITIIVQDQLPRSTDERIKVNLLEPQIDLKHPEKSRSKEAVLNKSNNVEWTLILQAQGSREVLLKYTVEHPAQFKLHKNLLDTKED